MIFFTIKLFGRMANTSSQWCLSGMELVATYIERKHICYDEQGPQQKEATLEKGKGEVYFSHLYVKKSDPGCYVRKKIQVALCLYVNRSDPGERAGGGCDLCDRHAGG